jgi:GalNAc-alpha-(1->4)-GalNAc-alpha-(1->3)-diNAcBac-PP-undecaprenol alpha-1,4-N-acetyl-D-galactosaminyltransferase
VSKSKKKICLVIPSLQAGGMERVMAELATFLALKESLKVNLVLYGISRSLFYRVHENVKIQTPEFEFNSRLRIFSTLRTLAYLRSVVKKNSPDAVLSYGEYWNSFVLIALYGLKYPIYISDRCQPDKKFGSFQSFLRNRLYRKATGIVAQTERAKEIYFKQFNHPNIEVIANPVREIKHANDIKKDNWILSVGRLINTKHHDRLIHIFSKLKAPDWKLVIVGGDALKQQNLKILQQLLSDLNLTGKVLLEGERNNVDEYYHKSRIFAFTSSSEGFPNVIGEALSAGLPAVSYNCVAGPAEMIVDGKNGFLIPVFDDDLFLEKLQLLIDDKTLLNRMSEEAKISIKRFSVTEIGEKYYSFITSHS